MENSIYKLLTQKYYFLEREKKRLIKLRDDAVTKIEYIEETLIDLNDILCKHGTHFYDHFEEREENDAENE